MMYIMQKFSLLLVQTKPQSLHKDLLLSGDQLIETTCFTASTQNLLYQETNSHWLKQQIIAVCTQRQFVRRDLSSRTHTCCMMLAKLQSVDQTKTNRNPHSHEANKQINNLYTKTSSTGDPFTHAEAHKLFDKPETIAPTDPTQATRQI